MTKTVVPTITVDTAAYVAGDVVGGIITLSDMNPELGSNLELETLIIREAGGQTPALNILFFKETPSGGTYTDNSAFAWGSGDLANCIGIVQILTTDWFTVNSKSVLTAGGINQIHKASDFSSGSGRDKVYMLILAGTGGYDAVTAADFSMELEYKVVD